VIAAILPVIAYGSIAQSKVQLAAHHGDWRSAPENPLPGFKYAAGIFAKRKNRTNNIILAFISYIMFFFVVFSLTV
jgi:hypothetical protein